jgi:hypothetical protein
MSSDRTTEPSAAAPAAAGAAWDLTLDELEAAVLAAESLALGAGDGAGAAQAWAPPAGLGPLPASREPRARALAERQQAAVEALTEARDRSARQLAALEQMSSSADRSAAPSYLDQAL